MASSQLENEQQIIELLRSHLESIVLVDVSGTRNISIFHGIDTDPNNTRKPNLPGESRHKGTIRIQSKQSSLINSQSNIKPNLDSFPIFMAFNYNTPFDTVIPKLNKILDTLKYIYWYNTNIGIFLSDDEKNKLLTRLGKQNDVSQRIQHYIEQAMPKYKLDVLYRQAAAAAVAAEAAFHRKWSSPMYKATPEVERMPDPASGEPASGDPASGDPANAYKYLKYKQKYILLKAKLGNI